MTWRGHANWPPNWNGPHGPNSPLPRGEVGILTGLEIGAPSVLGPHCIFFNQIVEILRQHVGSTVSEIGSLNPSNKLP